MKGINIAGCRKKDKKYRLKKEKEMPRGRKRERERKIQRKADREK